MDEIIDKGASKSQRSLQRKKRTETQKENSKHYTVYNWNKYAMRII